MTNLGKAEISSCALRYSIKARAEFGDVVRRLGPGDDVLARLAAEQDVDPDNLQKRNEKLLVQSQIHAVLLPCRGRYAPSVPPTGRRLMTSATTFMAMTRSTRAVSRELLLTVCSGFYSRDF